MKITLKDEYKSLQPFESDALNDFTIITGQNGSGKSQLLDLINFKSQGNNIVRNIRFNIDPITNSIYPYGLTNWEISLFNYQQWKDLIYSFASNIIGISLAKKKLIEYLIDNKLTSYLKKDLDKNLIKTFIIEEISYKKFLSDVSQEFFNTKISANDIQIFHQNIILESLFDYKYSRIVSEILNYTNKNILQISESDFYNVPLNEFLIYHDLFSSRLDGLFYSYAKRRDRNQRNYFEKKEYGELNPSVSDNEFTKKFSPPWKLINDIFNHHKLDFVIEGISRKDFTIEAPFRLNLIKKSINKIISQEDLSSGEKVIIGLIIKLFTSEYYGNEMTFPDLIILDEPDAHLHPQMSKLLLDVLEETFVKKYNVKVLITTHSPSTIALAPEESIYELKNGINSSLKKISKDDALQILTSFIPTLSIDYKNHKQVFLESPTDVEYFKGIHDKHLQNKIFSNKLYFISNGYGKGNCSQVYDIVEEIRKSGNQTSYGIVDWDLKNNPKNFMSVHGYKERYSIENFILDPIYVICLLMDMQNAHGIFERVGFDRTYNQYLIGNESDEKLQQIVEFYFLQFQSEFPNYKYETEKTQIKYLNGKKINIPKWYLEMRGHEIATKIKKVFSALNKYSSEGHLQNAISLLIPKCYPFVPLASVAVIEEILNHK